MQPGDSLLRIVPEFALLGVLAPLLAACGSATAKSTTPQPQPAQPAAPAPSAAHNVQTVFLIVMENHNWTGDGALSIANNPAAPYINQTLVPMGAYASNYNNPATTHPSLPNYLWLEAGTNFGITQDGPSVAADTQSTTLHLVTLLNNAGISWREYSGDTDGTTCPLISPWHIPFVFFSDVVSNLDPNSQNCISHIRPISELDTDLTAGTFASYNFISPNDCFNMHSSCTGDNQILTGDTWLSQEVPKIMATGAYKSGGAIFIVFDEADSEDGPIPMLVISPFGKTGGYTNSTYFEHGSMLRTMQEIFGLTPLIRDAELQTDLSDFFAQFP